jgi:serine/threonine protein kinase
MAGLVGRTIANRYFVASFLGQGGMAEVYKVWDKSRMANVAIKVLHENLTGEGAFLDHFRREAGTLASLQHPNIVRFYSLEQHDNIAFIVMDYVEGSTLREVMKSSGIIQFQTALRFMRDICSALNYAHELGYVHCDIKPANIMINKNGSCLVSDFGIAQLTGGPSSSMSTAGTAGYIAPEQIQRGAPTAASDIYALGVLLYELLTARRPFAGHSTKSEGSTSDRIRWEQINLAPPSPRQYNPAISTELERLILRCLERDISRRYTSVQNLLSALEPILLREMSQPLADRGRDTVPPLAPSIETNAPAVNARQRSSKRMMLMMISGIFIFMMILMMNTSGNPPISPATTAISRSPIPNASATPVWKHYNATELGFVVEYPPKWLYELDEDDASMVFASSHEAMNAEVVSADGAAIAIARGMISTLSSDANPPYVPADLLDEFISSKFAGVKIVGEQRNLEIDSLPAATVIFRANIPDAQVDVVLTVTLILDGESCVMMLGFAPESLWKTYQPVFERMRDTLDLNSSYKP